MMADTALLDFTFPSLSDHISPLFPQAYWLPLLFLKYSGQRLSEGFCTCSCFCFQYSSYKQCYISPTLGFCPVLNLEIFYLPIHSFIFLHSTYLTSDLLFYYVYSFCLLSFCIHYKISISGKIFFCLFFFMSS